MASQKSLLESVIGAASEVDAGWTFTANGYSDGSPVYLSMDTAPGDSDAALSIWHYDGSIWTPYAPVDLVYNGTDASFTVTGFSGYAVTSLVPEPACTSLLMLAGVATLSRRRQCQWTD